MNERIKRALDRARSDAATLPKTGIASAVAAPTRRLAIGDPQAPLETFLAILDAHAALGDDGRIASDVQLVSMGDHFDWGKPADRERATRDGTALLSWLAAHPAEQVVILLGNHDLSRVCELSHFRDDAQYVAARAKADALYKQEPAPEAEKAFLAEHPFVASVEVLARDLSTFNVAQRRLVQTLLEARRVCLAHAAAPELLLVHGAVTTDDLQLLGAHPSEMKEAETVATMLNGFLARIVESWDGSEPLDLEPLHRSQGAEGEGRGILFQRPAHPERTEPAETLGPPRRRYDPRRIPVGLTQGVGHIRDNKTRLLLGDWAKGEAPKEEGALRTLRTNGITVRYEIGVQTPIPGEGAVLFLDGGMNWTSPERYELLDLDTRRPATRR